MDLKATEINVELFFFELPCLSTAPKSFSVSIEKERLKKMCAECLLSHMAWEK